MTLCRLSILGTRQLKNVNQNKTQQTIYILLLFGLYEFMGVPEENGQGPDYVSPDVCREVTVVAQKCLNVKVPMVKCDVLSLVEEFNCSNKFMTLVCMLGAV